MSQDREILVQKLIERQPSLEPDKNIVLGALGSQIDVYCMSLLTTILGLANLQSLPLFCWLDLASSPIERLSRCAENGMPWVIPVVAWVNYAIRPLSQKEFNRIFETEWS